MKNCKECSSSFTPKPGTVGFFCSKSCSTRFNNRQRPPRSEESKAKTAKTLTGSTHQHGNGRNFCTVVLHNCKICQKTYYTNSTSKRSTCGNKACHAAACVSKTSRIGSTNSIYWNHPTQGTLRFDSSWEETIAKYLDQSGIKWIRPKSGIAWEDSKGVKHHYFPDFYLPRYDLYLDPKNDKVIRKDEEKLEKVQEQIKLHYGSPQHLISILDNLSG